MSPATTPPARTRPLRLLELYCGIGGATAAVGTRGLPVGAFDIDTTAVTVYRANHAHPAAVRNLESMGAAELGGAQADLWWLSPPCQPFTRRGRQRDDRDPRSASLLALLPRVPEVRPRYLALENVPGFPGSRTHRRLRAVLSQAGYRVREEVVCPSELGFPNRRRRFYLLAARDAAPSPFPPRRGDRRPLAAFLDPDDDPALAVDPDLAERYRHALDIVGRDDPHAVTACFTAAYGRSPVRSGSYLRTATGLRRFSPAEIVRLLGFPRRYALPAELSREVAWRLVGNSLSLPAVRWVLAAIPELAALAGPSAAPLGTVVPPAPPHL